MNTNTNARKTTRKTTAKAATPKAAPKAKADPFAAVKDDHKVASGAIAYALFSADRAYMERVMIDGPVLAARVHAGESQADIARGLCEAAKEDGRVVSLSAAKMRVSRYVRIGDALVKAGPKADREEIVTAKSKDVRKGTEKGKATPKAKNPADAIKAATGTLSALVDLVTEKGTKADRDALVALAETFLRGAKAAQALAPVEQAA